MSTAGSRAVAPASRSRTASATALPATTRWATLPVIFGDAKDVPLQVAQPSNVFVGCVLPPGSGSSVSPLKSMNVDRTSSPFVQHLTQSPWFENSERPPTSSIDPTLITFEWPGQNAAG